MLHSWQRPQVEEDQRQAGARMDDQLITGAIVPPDGLATHEGRQACRPIQRDNLSRRCCVRRDTTMSVHCAAQHHSRSVISLFTHC